VPVLEISNLFSGYFGTAVVRDLSLTVEEGEVVAIFGPNGAGKTTTLLTVSGLVQPMDGDVKVLGRSVRGVKPHVIARHGVSHVPEERALFAQLSVRDNLRLGTARRSDVAEATRTVLRHFPALEELLGRRAGLLSGGEQQMLALGRALISRPRLLMVDEMSLGLAPIVVNRLLPILGQIAAETGCGVLLVEQHVALAMEVAERAYVLSHGDLVLQGSTEELAANRALLEASYLGERAVDDLVDRAPA
jgi:branched-chain amino acid transport system ATP-binding protein